MVVLLLLPNVVGKVRCVPDYHVPVANILPIDESVKVSSEGRSNGNGTVVDLSLVKPQYPHVATPEVIRGAVVRARDQVVGIVSLRVPDLPPSALLGPAAPFGLKLESVPVISGEDGRGIELADRVVLCGADVEVQPPVDVVVVEVADSRIPYGRESEPRTDGPVVVEAPLADVAVPARLHLADHNRLLPRAVDRDTEEVTRVRP